MPDYTDTTVNQLVFNVLTSAKYQELQNSSQINADQLYLITDDSGGGSGPSPYASNPAMDGTASPGSSSDYARGDHVHPTDTSLQTKITASGILKGNGSGTVSAATAGTDYQEPISFDGTYSSSNKAATVSTVTNAINALDGGTIGTGGTTKTITSLSQSNGNVSATFSDIAFPTEILTVTATRGASPSLLISADVTYADIYAAMAAGKTVIVKFLETAGSTNYGYFYSLGYPYYSGDTLYFSQAEPNTERIQYLSVTSSNYWQFDYLALAPKYSPTFTGVPKAPTASAGTDTTQIATTAFVQTEISNLSDNLIFGFKTNDNSGTTSGIYKIFLKVKQNTTTTPCMGQFLVTGMSNVTQANQGLYILSIFNRSSTFTPSVLRIKGHYGSQTWGYYLADGYYYVGAYISSNYTAFPDVWEINSNHSTTYGFELGNFVHSATQPTGWTTFTSDGLLATTADIDTAIGSAILASY